MNIVLQAGRHNLSHRCIMTLTICNMYEFKRRKHGCQTWSYRCDLFKCTLNVKNPSNNSEKGRHAKLRKTDLLDFSSSFLSWHPSNLGFSKTSHSLSSELVESEGHWLVGQKQTRHILTWRPKQQNHFQHIAACISRKEPMSTDKEIINNLSKILAVLISLGSLGMNVFLATSYGR